MTEPSSEVSLDEGLELETSDSTKKNLLTSGSVVGGLAMTACCIVPLILFSLGVTGAWIGNLMALFPYRLYFLAATVVFLAGGFYLVYRKPSSTECVEGSYSYCASPLSDRVNKIMLWSASLLVVAAMAFPYIAPLYLY